MCSQLLYQLFKEHPFLFQCDSALVYKARPIKKVVFPQSPDHDPTQHLWDELDRQ